MIPKILHYCWFGRGEFSEKMLICFKSWRNYLPEYEIREWNEDNFDINFNMYVKQAYKSKRYAFVSDYVRLYALYNYGGIYLDTDVEILKPLDKFLNHYSFSGFECKDCVPTAVMGSEKHSPIIKEMLSYYDGRFFINNKGEMDTTTNVKIITNLLIKKGLKLNGKKQTIEGLCLYPQIYFAPNTISMIFSKKPINSYAIHHFEGSWIQDKKSNSRIRKYIVGNIRNLIGTERLIKLKSFRYNTKQK
jgi:mannosyltransferase OCH1-like enzyme